MAQIKSSACSCLTCRKPYTAKGIHTHYIISHTAEGQARHLKNVHKNYENLVVGRDRAISQHLEAVTQYEHDPKHCLQCHQKIPYEKRTNQFCNMSCSAKHTNLNRSPESKARQAMKASAALKGKRFPRVGAQPTPYTRIVFCVICGTLAESKSTRTKTCSKTCTSKLISQKIIERIKENKRSNYRRDKKSYLESSFEQWLLSIPNHPSYEDEYTIHNTITGQWYFVDFYFPTLNLIVELDGKQHLNPDHQKEDAERDQYIQDHLKINVFRISYDEYQAKTRLNTLLEILTPKESSTNTSSLD